MGNYQEQVKGTVQIAGYNSGFIDLFNGDILTDSVVPMSFWSTKQLYKYDKAAKVLTITGTHPKFSTYQVDLHIA